MISRRIFNSQEKIKKYRKFSFLEINISKGAQLILILALLKLILNSTYTLKLILTDII